MKKIAALMASTAAVVVIFSVACIAAEADHDCTGVDCPVCVCIVQCLENLRMLGTGVEGCAEIFVAEKFSVPTAARYVCLSVALTPVNQKVRLDD